VNRAVRKPKPGQQQQQQQWRGNNNNRNTFTAKKIFSGKKPANSADEKKTKQNFKKNAGDDRTAFKKTFRPKFKKSDQNKKSSFQGFTTTSGGAAEAKKFKKPRWNKTDKKKKIIAEKLAS